MTPQEFQIKLIWLAVFFIAGYVTSRYVAVHYGYELRRFLADNKRALIISFVVLTIVSLGIELAKIISKLW